MLLHWLWNRLPGLGAVLLVLGGVCWYDGQPGALVAGEATAFLQQHWRVPIPPQGPPPTQFTPLEASLYPEDCGRCHPQQYQDWQQSLHRRSMGPGVMGQLLDMTESDPAAAAQCAPCHAPLHEQLPVISDAAGVRPNPVFDPRLQQDGLVCAACHVRQQQRFGPPRRPEQPVPPAGTVLPHGGFTAQVAFQRAEFCQSCHQFPADGFALHGKLLENTYEEWRQSAYAREGIPCQTCHMPDRRHLWRGIHDPDMVRRALTLHLTPDTLSAVPGGLLEVTVSLTNSGAGHYFPTYVTPKVFLQAQLLDTQGAVLSESVQEAVLGRDVSLDLSTELYDTRIPPHAVHTLVYRQTLPAAAALFRVQVVVHPDHFYQRFFTALLSDSHGPGRAHLEAALQATNATPFTLVLQDVPLRFIEPAPARQDLFP
ncbi:MAG: multiheme c-type cytochrome [Candidatus Tectimicrobiota bacterium]